MAYMMVRTWNLRLLKVKILFILLFISTSLYSQFVFLDSVKVNNPVYLANDRSGNVYLGDKLGNVFKYDQDLKLINEYSPNKKGSIAVLEPWNPLKVFVSYSDLQEYQFLDRFLVSANRFKLNGLSSFIGLSAPSLDNNLWLVDFSTFSLKKYNMSFNQVDIERPFDLLLDPKKFDITHIREYQNLVFISDSNSGILVFDNLGNYLYKIEATGVEYFSFVEGNILYVENEALVKLNLYSNEKNVNSLPKNVDRVVETNKFTFFLREKWLLKAQKQ